MAKKIHVVTRAVVHVTSIELNHWLKIISFGFLETYAYSDPIRSLTFIHIKRNAKQ